MSFTKGPWFIHEGGYVKWRFDGGFNGRILNIDGQTVIAGPSSFKALRGETEEEAKANAHLIAAAPIMYEALKDYIHGAFEHGNKGLIDSIDPDGELLDQMIRAVDKAEGKT